MHSVMICWVVAVQAVYFDSIEARREEHRQNVQINQCALPTAELRDRWFSTFYGVWFPS